MVSDVPAAGALRLDRLRLFPFVLSWATGFRDFVNKPGRMAAVVARRGIGGWLGLVMNLASRSLVLLASGQ